MSTFHLDVISRPDHRGSTARTVGVATLTAVVVALLGFPLGWAWAAVAPRLQVIKVAGGFIYAEAEPEQPIAADGWFALLGAGVGVLVAIAAWLLLRRYRGVLVLVAAVVGALVAGCVAWWVGTKIGVSGFEAVGDTAAVGARLDGPLGLRITDLDSDQLWPFQPTGVVAVQALMTAFTYTCLAGFSAYGDLRSADRPTALDHPEAHPWPSQSHLDQSHPIQPPPDRPQPDQTDLGSEQPDQIDLGPGQSDRSGPAQFGPGLTGRSDSATGTART